MTRAIATLCALLIFALRLDVLMGVGDGER